MTLRSPIKFDAERKKMCKLAITGSTGYKDKEEKVLETFKSWDKDQNNYISKEELSDVLLHLGCKTSSDEVEKMFKEADLDKDGKINYEEMVHWMCRAPHLEEYFVKSVEIEKKNFLSVFDTVQAVTKEIGDLEKKCNESGVDVEKDPEALKSVLDVFKRMDGLLLQIQQKSREMIKTELTPIIKRSFAYHDKDASGQLSKDESIIFFSNFMALWEPFDKVMAEMNCICEGVMHNSSDEESEKKEKVLKKVKVVTPVMLHETFKTKYAVLKQEQAKSMEQHLKKAFECLSVEGQIKEAAVVEALLHGSEKNKEFMEAMGLGEAQGISSLKLAELTSQELGGTMEDLEMGLKMMQGMESFAKDVENDQDDCQVQ